MPAIASDPVQDLVRPILDRLETAPVEFVEAFIDLLTAPSRRREERLRQDLLVQAWLLLEQPESFSEAPNAPFDSEALLRAAGVTPYDRLIQFMCGLIEAQMLRSWLLPRQEKTPLARASQLFWGGLTLHIKLALPHEPCRGNRLLSNGMVVLPHSNSFSCEPPLSESQVYELVTLLGSSFVLDYASAYFRNETLCTLVASQKPRNNSKSPSAKENLQLDKLLVQKRSLNRYVNRFSKYLAATFHDGCVHLANKPSNRVLAPLSSASLNSALAQIMSEASSALLSDAPDPKTRKRSSSNIQEPLSSSLLRLFSTHAPDLREQHVADTSTNNSPPDAALPPFIRECASADLLESVICVQETAVRDSIHTNFVAPNLEYADLLGAVSRPASIDDFSSSKNQHLFLTAPPGGGKTRLQQELLLRARNSGTFHLWIEIRDFPSSGFRSFHRFAANQLLDLVCGNPELLFRLEDDLISLDRNGRICWHLNGWDELAHSDRLSTATECVRLSQFILSTSNQAHTLGIFKSRGLSLSGVVKIQPFTQNQILEFIRANLTGDIVNGGRIGTRTLQLPGIARLPGGLEYICAHFEDETCVDILLGYLDFALTQIGQPKIDPNELVYDGLKEIGWQSDVLTSAYLIAKATLNHSRRISNDAVIKTRYSSSSEHLSQIQIDEISPYMGTTKREENRQLAMERIEKVIRGKLLQVNDDGQTYRFVVPEIGYLLAAIAVLSRVHGRRWLDRALRVFEKDPHNPIHQMTLALGAWHQERLYLRHA